MSPATGDVAGADPFVRVVVLNWNSLWYTSRCLAALRDSEYPADRLEVVLADNGSDDGSLEVLRLRHPEVRIVANGANLGFAEGCNRAMRDLDGVDLVALVNNDAVVEPGWLRPLVTALQDDPRAAVAAAELLLEPAFARIELDLGAARGRLAAVRLDGRDVLARCRFDGAIAVGDPDWPLQIHHELEHRVVLWVPDATGADSLEIELVDLVRADAAMAVTVTVAGGVDGSASYTVPTGESSVRLTVGLAEDRTELLNGLGTGLTEDLEGIDLGFGRPAAELDTGSDPQGFCGGGALLRAQVLAEVGLFDPAYFAYYEDTDLSWRIRRAGWRIVAVPGSRIHHAFGGAGGSAASWFFFLNYRNWLLTVLRNGDRAQVRRALAKAWDQSSRSVRGNVIGRARRGRRPSFRLSAAWLRVLAGVAAALPHVIRSRRRGRVGVQATATVGSRLQPTPSFPVPRSRAGGPQLVYVDRELLRAELARPDAPAERVWAFADDLDVVVIRWAAGSWWRCGPAEVAELTCGPTPSDRVAPSAEGPATHRLATPDPYAVVVTATTSPAPPAAAARSLELEPVTTAGSDTPTPGLWARVRDAAGLADPRDPGAGGSA